VPLQFNFASPNYASAVELALGPVLFMSVSMLLNSSIGVRLGHVMDRAKFLRGDSVRVLDEEHEHELGQLRLRARLLQRAMRASSLGALMFAMVITLSFLTAFLQVDLSMVLAGCFLTALLGIVTSLIVLLRESDLALNNLRL
jgi:hypothetical protein